MKMKNNLNYGRCTIGNLWITFIRILIRTKIVDIKQKRMIGVSKKIKCILNMIISYGKCSQISFLVNWIGL